MSARNKNLVILCAIWGVAMSGVLVCWLATPLLKFDKAPRLRAALHTTSVAICELLQTMVTYQQNFAEGR